MVTCQRGLGCTAGELLPVLTQSMRCTDGGERHTAPLSFSATIPLTLGPFQQNSCLFHWASQKRK